MCADETGPKKPLSDTVRQLGALSSVGLSFVLAVVLGAGLGLLIDRWLGTSPWGFFVFFAASTLRGLSPMARTPWSVQLASMT